MRLFLAIEISDKIKKKINEQLMEIKKDYRQLQWVSAENFHITVHFFGETDKVEQIKKKIKDLIWDQTGFFLYSLDLDVLANHKIVVYLTFRREKKLEELAKRMQSEFSFNSVNEKKFVPHLTLAKGKRSSKQQYFVLKKRLAKTTIDVSFKINKLVLFESVSNGSESVYKKIQIFKLL